MTWLYARALYQADGATLDDLREAVETLEDVERLWKRVFGEAHPETPRVQGALATRARRWPRAPRLLRRRAPRDKFETSSVILSTPMQGANEQRAVRIIISSALHNAS